MAKLKANKMLMVKLKLEIALVRPGVTPELGTRQFEEREINLNLLDVYLVQKAKGTQ